MFSSKQHDPVINMYHRNPKPHFTVCMLSRCSGWGVLRAVKLVLEQISFIFCQQEASAGCWVTPGPLLGYHKSPHQQTVKVFSLSLGLFNLLQWKVFVFSWLCWTSQHDSHVASHTFSEPYLEQEIGKLTAGAWRGMDCQASIIGRAITPIGPIIKYRDMSWVTRHGVMTHDRSHVISMSLTAQHSPLSGVSGLSSWHLRERQPSTVSIDGAGMYSD